MLGLFAYKLTLTVIKSKRVRSRVITEQGAGNCVRTEKDGPRVPTVKGKEVTANKKTDD